MGRLALDPTSPSNVTLPAEAALSCSEMEDSLAVTEVIMAMPRCSAIRLPNARATHDWVSIAGRLPRPPRRANIHLPQGLLPGFARLYNAMLPSISFSIRVRSVALRRRHVTPSEYLEHDCKGCPLPVRGSRRGLDADDGSRFCCLPPRDHHRARRRLSGAGLEYYASRGETPLLWGGLGAEALGLVGPVDNPSYDAIYGPGGACDPVTGERLVNSQRPGMELVIAAHKSVAELGVLGRVEDMHAIMDAERDATLAYLDHLTKERGGRRGVAAVPTATTGLVYAHARHATTRAGDPGPHDHVLIANVIEMLDEKGGTKAPDTTLWREHLHAATMVGRVASAATAVELGYGIEADPGPSGKLGHWKICGIPDKALAVHSKRAAEINQAVAEKGFDSYQARQVAARETRKTKRHTPVDELLPRWRNELTDAGFPPEQLVADIEQAGLDYRREHSPTKVLWDKELAELTNDVLGPDGTLSDRKVFSKRDVIVAVAPKVFGLPARELEKRPSGCSEIRTPSHWSVFPGQRAGLCHRPWWPPNRPSNGRWSGVWRTWGQPR